MPVKIHFETASIEDQIASLRKKIKDGEGLTIEEISRAVERSPTQISKICLRRGWFIKQFCTTKRNYINLLVNDKTLELCRKK